MSVISKWVLGLSVLMSAISASPSAHAAGATCPTPRVTLVNRDAGRVDWGPDRIAYDRAGSNGCYDVYTAEADGSDERCVTCALFPWNRNRGQPAYHPGGRYLIYQAEKAEHGTHPKDIPCGIATHPGSGVFNDIWYTDLVTGASRALVSVPYGPNSGVLHPHISPDGKKLSWSQLYEAPRLPPVIGFEAGKWALMTAELKIDAFGRLSASTPRQLFPAPGSGEGFVENHGYTPDSQAILFSSNFDFITGNYDRRVTRRSDIHVGVPGPSGTFTAKQVSRVTNLAYNEHGFLSVTGILTFMSTIWNPLGRNDMNDGTEFTSLTPQGRACRLSHFNEPGYQESQGLPMVAADMSWSPDGKSLLGYAHSVRGELEQLWRFDFE